MSDTTSELLKAFVEASEDRKAVALQVFARGGHHLPASAAGADRHRRWWHTGGGAAADAYRCRCGTLGREPVHVMEVVPRRPNPTGRNTPRQFPGTASGPGGVCGEVFCGAVTIPSMAFAAKGWPGGYSDGQGAVMEFWS